jgi:hypothetical protein
MLTSGSFVPIERRGQQKSKCTFIRVQYLFLHKTKFFGDYLDVKNMYSRLQTKDTALFNFFATGLATRYYQSIGEEEFVLKDGEIIEKREDPRTMSFSVYTSICQNQA